MSGHVIAVAERLLRHGLSRRATARKLRDAGEQISEQTVRRIADGEYTPQRQITYRRCACGGLVRADRPCLACQLTPN